MAIGERIRIQQYSPEYHAAAYQVCKDAILSLSPYTETWRTLGPVLARLPIAAAFSCLLSSPGQVLMALFMYEAFLSFYCYFGSSVSYVRYHLPSNMTDKELSFFTSTETNNFFLAIEEETDQVVGTSGCFTSHHGAKLNLTRVNIDSKYRGQRVASRLVGEIKKHARKFGFKTLNIATLSSQKAAVNMYEKDGARLISMSKHECHPYSCYWTGYFTGIWTSRYEIELD